MIEPEEDGHVWIVRIGVLDSECYAVGTETAVAAYRSRDGAIAAIREAFAPPFVADPVASFESDPDDDIAWGSFTEGDGRFEWDWSIRKITVKDD